MNNDVYDPESDERFRPNSMASDFADEITEYIGAEANTPQEAQQIAEQLLTIIRDRLQAEDWQQVIDARINFMAAARRSFGSDDDEDDED